MSDRSNAIAIDPRVIAEALHMGTDDLARVLTIWAAEAMPVPNYDYEMSPTPLEKFDAMVGQARQLLEDAHAAQKAWEDDNPWELDTPDDEASQS